MIALTPQVLAEIDKRLESSLNAYQKAGDQLFAVFEPDEGRVSSQVRNLQQTTCAAVRLSQVENFIKNQMGRSREVAEKWVRVGPLLLEQVDMLRKQAENIAKKFGLSEDEELEVRLRLARGWVSTLVSQYMYRFGLARLK